MKIAVAVILAIASAHNGINPKPTMDLDYVEIGPDAVKEDIPGADVFKNANGGDKPDIDVTFTFNAEDIIKIVEPYEVRGVAVEYKCTGNLTIGSDSPKDYNGATLVFRHFEDKSQGNYEYDALLVRTEKTEQLWMTNDGKHFGYNFRDMRDNNATMQKLYDDKDKKETEEKTMKWIIGKSLKNYDTMVENTKEVVKILKELSEHKAKIVTEGTEVTKAGKGDTQV